jgi:hypothetical protein
MQFSSTKLVSRNSRTRVRALTADEHGEIHAQLLDFFRVEIRSTLSFLASKQEIRAMCKLQKIRN